MMQKSADKITPLQTKQTPNSEDFFYQRKDSLSALDSAPRRWNDAVASLVELVGAKITNYASYYSGNGWHQRVALALRSLDEPLKSDVILSNNRPLLKNAYLRGSVRVFGSCLLENDLEFMPKEFEYPKFPYFQVEPARLSTLSKAGLALLANAPGIEEEEPDQTGAMINMTSYTMRPMVSVELDLKELGSEQSGALLLNWSCRGREGAMAKVFVNGTQDVPAFEVRTTSDDPTPNFWTFVPWSGGNTVIDLKMVGSGYLWFEHVDVHSVFWLDRNEK